MKKNRYKGIVCIVCSAFCFALMNVFVRAAGDLPSMQKSFFRNVVALAFAIIIMKKNSIPFRCRRKNLRYLLIRSVCGTLGILCNYYAIDHLVLSDASMLNKMSPFKYGAGAVLYRTAGRTGCRNCVYLCAESNTEWREGAACRMLLLCIFLSGNAAISSV